MTLSVNIVIPTYNRAEATNMAVTAALAQSYQDSFVTVIDDGSSDNTFMTLKRFFADPRFLYIRLAKNLGTAQAKNVAIALTGYDAITFHDSDDIPDRDKVLLQARVLANPTIKADPILNWRISGREPSSTISVGAALTEHQLVRADGSTFHVRRALSLVDDVFPNLQMAAGPPGDWILINTGLFRREVFASLGGFAPCIEEDRELRNRMIMAGEVLWVVPQPLMTKIESADSLTVLAGTGYDSEERQRDRDLVWGRAQRWRSSGVVEKSPIELDDLAIDFVSNAERLSRADVLMTPRTENHLNSLLDRLGAVPTAA